jgi:hypothetical protein
MSEIAAWFHGRLPDDWFEEPADVQVDREEVMVTGRLAAPPPEPAPPPEAADAGSADEPGADEPGGAGGADPAGTADRAAAAGRIKRFREDTRGQRMRIAREAEARFGRKVAWAASCGEVSEVFTSLAVPVMTRLRQPERQVLDTLVDAGVARSRSEALAWCVRLVGTHEAEWIAQLREALVGVQQARRSGPAA